MDSTTLLADFVNFKKERSAEAKERLARKLCAYFAGRVRPEEKAILHDILFILSCDIELRVRRALAETLKSCPTLPREVALRLAQDVEEVAVPVLEYSEVFTDEDLEEIIRSHNELAKLQAIARRTYISPQVATCLIASEQEAVAKTLIANTGAEIPHAAMERLLELFGGCDDVMGMLIQRGGLSVGLAERMITHVSDKIRRQLVEAYGVSSPMIQRAVEESKETVMLDVVSGTEGETHTLTLVDHLYHSGKLTHSIVLRALCRVDMDFFEISIARLANIPIANARKLLRDGDSKAFAALYEAAALPESMMEAAEIMLRLLLADESKRRRNPASYGKEVMQRISDKGYDRSIPNMPYFLALLGSFVVEAAAGQRRMLAQSGT